MFKYMALRICPKCETNYLRPNESLCSVCRAAMKKRGGFYDDDEEVVLCANCGENPAVKGKDLCESCLMEKEKEDELEKKADQIRVEEIEDPVEEDISKVL